LPVRPIRGSPAIHPLRNSPLPKLEGPRSSASPSCFARALPALASQFTPVPLKLEGPRSSASPSCFARALPALPIFQGFAVKLLSPSCRFAQSGAHLQFTHVAIHPSPGMGGPALKRFALFHPGKLCLLGTPVACPAQSGATCNSPFPFNTVEAGARERP
jgi:hypothetical protein